MQTLRTCQADHLRNDESDAMRVTPGETVSRLFSANEFADDLRTHFAKLLKSIEGTPSKHPFFTHVFVEVDEHQATVSYADVSLRFAMQFHLPDGQAHPNGVVLCLLDCPLRTGNERPTLLGSFIFDAAGYVRLDGNWGQTPEMNWIGPILVAHYLERALSMPPFVSGDAA